MAPISKIFLASLFSLSFTANASAQIIVHGGGAGDYAEAQSHYTKAIEKRPKLAEAYINHAASLIYMANYDAAITSLDKAIEIGTEKMPEALYNRAVAYDRLKNYKYSDLSLAPYGLSVRFKHNGP